MSDLDDAPPREPESAQWAAAERDAPQPKRDGGIRIQTQFTPGFGDWLIGHRVGLVCPTHQTGHLLVIGARADGRPVPSAAAFSRAMGLVALSRRTIETALFVAISMQELRRLITHLRRRRPTDMRFNWYWSCWRRHNQAETKRAHYRKRGVRLHLTKPQL